MWPSAEWKRLVGASRNGNKTPKELRKYADATLVIGTISRKPSLEYSQLPSWTSVTENFVLKMKQQDGQVVNAVQYVFGDDGEEFLMNNAKIRVFLYTKYEVEDWNNKGGSTVLQ
jgi:hypothetical protein